jgi:hypothetical protein
VSWTQLEIELAEMFGDYTDREYEREMSIEWWASERAVARQDERAANRLRMRARYRALKHDQSFLTKKRALWNRRDKQRRSEDPQYAEKRRAATRERMRRLRARPDVAVAA